MAKLILKSPYIKSTGGASGYLKYIATRERVEIIPDDRPPTRKQEQLITKLVKDFPEVKECLCKTRAAPSYFGLLKSIKIFSEQNPNRPHCWFCRIFAADTSFIGYSSALPVLCVCKNTETEEATMMNQLPVRQCQHCGGKDIWVGWQSDALVTFKRNGLLGNRIKFLICGNCGAVLYQCVAEPHRFPQAR